MPDTASTSLIFGETRRVVSPVTSLRIIPPIVLRQRVNSPSSYNDYR